MNIHALSGIHTGVPSNQAAADLGHKPQDQRDRLVFHVFDKMYFLDATYKPCTCGTAAAGRTFCDGVMQLRIKTRPSLIYFFSCCDSNEIELVLGCKKHA